MMNQRRIRTTPSGRPASVWEHRSPKPITTHATRTFTAHGTTASLVLGDAAVLWPATWTESRAAHPRPVRVPFVWILGHLDSEASMIDDGNPASSPTWHVGRHALARVPAHREPATGHPASLRLGQPVVIGQSTPSGNAVTVTSFEAGRTPPDTKTLIQSIGPRVVLWLTTPVAITAEVGSGGSDGDRRRGSIMPSSGCRIPVEFHSERSSGRYTVSRSNVTPEIAKAIRRDRTNGASLREVGRRFGVSHQTVNAICSMHWDTRPGSRKSV